jgi:hypothetical protein
MPTSTATILHDVTQQYLKSGDFNGYPVRSIVGDNSAVRQIVRKLIESGDVSINFGDGHPNPHIKAFPAEPVATQLTKLETADLQRACLYPTPKHLSSQVIASDYSGRPFTLRLALGAAALELQPFDLKVLEPYRNDPRYSYQTDDIQGSLSVSDKYYDTSEMHQRDQVMLQNFGFGYDKEITTRVVVAFLADLRKLTPEHQQVWESNRLDGEYLPHPDFWASMMGEWPEYVSLFQAFGEELKQINAMAVLMGRAPLFREDFADGNRPSKFGFLLRPTLSEYNAFVHLLDKTLSENIDVAFFQDEVSLENIEVRKDGTHVAKPKGSITVLAEWLARTFRAKEPQILEGAIATLKKVRKLRQKPAHAVKADEFDQKYFQDQRALMMEAYEAVRTLRLVLANHPATKGHQVPDWLFEGHIRSR